MKKRKGIFLFGLIMLLTMLFGMNAMAGSPKVVILKSNKLYNKFSGNYSDVTYYKINVARSGYITVYGYGYRPSSNSKYSLGGVQLCNSRKKALEKNKTYVSAYTRDRTYYGVKKGTYYLRIEGNNYKLKYSFTAVSEKSGSSKSTAVEIKKGTTKRGLLIAGESGSKTDWYKIRLTNKQKVRLTFGARANDHVSFKIIPANPKVFIPGSTAYYKNTTETVKTKDALPTGIYYIRVNRMSKDADTSGYYTLKWK